MANVVDLCNWIDLLVDKKEKPACLGRIPKQILRQIKHPERLSIPSDYQVSDHHYDFILAFNERLPETVSDVSSLAHALFSNLCFEGAVLVVLTSHCSQTSSRHHERMHRLLALATMVSASSLSVRARVVLDDLGWGCYLINRGIGELRLPSLRSGWDDHCGDIMMRALNGSKIDSDYIGWLDDIGKSRKISETQDLFELLRQAEKIAQHHFHLECSGWSHIPLKDDQICLIAGMVSVPGQNRTRRLVSGTGSCWHEASLLMVCEAVERISDAVRPTADLAGIAFGFNKKAAQSRALLEFFERYSFSRSFVDNDALPFLDIASNERLSSLVRQLNGINGQKKLFVLSSDEPFEIVLALSMPMHDGKRVNMHYGLGCAFDLESAAYKAVLETVQVHAYDQSVQGSSGFQNIVNSVQALHCHRFWEMLDHEKYLDKLSNGSSLSLKNDSYYAECRREVTDEYCLELVTNWCAMNGIDIQYETLFSSQIDRQGWVIRVMCSNLPRQMEVIRNPENVPFPLTKTL